MNKHVEKEYKMLVNKEQFDKLCSLYENLNFITQTNTYYDTVNGDIQKRRVQCVYVSEMEGFCLH